MEVLEVSKDIVKALYPSRTGWSHKGDYGKVLIIGGSEKYTGAPALAAMAALRSGSDLAFIMAPKRAADVDASLSPNIIAMPVDAPHFTKKHVKEALEQIRRVDAVLIGPGIGTEPETLDFVEDVVSKIKKPCVVDADALKAIKGKKIGKTFVITPHEGEYKFLTGDKPEIEPNRRLSQVSNLADKMNCTVLLKAHVDVISDNVSVAVNETGNPYMTKGGTGDVLAGVIVSLLGRRVKPFDAACGGAFITGSAGDVAAKNTGEGLLATDVIDTIPLIVNMKK